MVSTLWRGQLGLCVRCTTRGCCVTVLLYVRKFVCEWVHARGGRSAWVCLSGKWTNMPASHTVVLLCNYCISVCLCLQLPISLSESPSLALFCFVGTYRVIGWSCDSVVVMDYKGLSQPHLWICYCVNRYSIDTKQLANMEEINLEQIKRFL